MMVMYSLTRVDSLIISTIGANSIKSITYYMEFCTYIIFIMIVSKWYSKQWGIIMGGTVPHVTDFFIIILGVQMLPKQSREYNYCLSSKY